MRAKSDKRVCDLNKAKATDLYFTISGKLLVCTPNNVIQVQNGVTTTEKGGLTYAF